MAVTSVIFVRVIFVRAIFGSRTFDRPRERENGKIRVKIRQGDRDANHDPGGDVIGFRAGGVLDGAGANQRECC
jgi:hypothetical protein